MTKPRIVVTRRWPAAVEARLQQLFDTRINESDRPLSAEQLQEALREADALCPTVSDRITAEILGATPRRARIIASYGVGLDHIDLKGAQANGLVVTNTPGVLTDATADLTMALILAIARRVVEGDNHVRAGAWTGWRPTHMLGTQVTGKTLGLIGFGRIAQAVAQRAHHGFGMQILYFTRTPDRASAAGIAAQHCTSLDELLAESDFVSLHCPSTPETRHLIDERRLARMKRSAFLINTARGDVVHQPALIAALRSGGIAGAGLDVYEGEPAVPRELMALPNVVLLPHLGSATEETRTAMGMKVIANLEAFFAGREPPDLVTPRAG